MNKVTTFYKRLNQLMAARGLTQAEFVKQCSLIHDEKNTTVSQASLSQYIKGERIPRPARAKILARVLNVNVNYLLGYDVDPNDPDDCTEITSSYIVPEDIYDRTMLWLQESGWRFRYNKTTRMYNVRKKGWNYERAVEIPEEKFHQDLRLVLGFWELLVKQSLRDS